MNENDLPAGALAGLNSAADVPFMLTLESEGGGECRFRCERLLRILPGRRLVMLALLDGQSVVLKLFCGSGRDRYLAREARGLQWLNQSGVPVAESLGRVRGDGVVGLVLRYLPDARVLDSHQQAYLEQAAHLIGRMHAVGVWQKDVHLNNYLLSAGRVHAVDGDGVRQRSRPLSAAAGISNLALLAAQRPPAEDVNALALLDAYRQGRAMTAPQSPETSQSAETSAQSSETSQSAETFARRLTEARAERTRRYLEKVQRPCTEYAVERGWNLSTFILRGRGEEPMARLLENADQLFADGQLLKAGNSATVVRSSLAQSFVIKRFNVKNLGHGLRRSLRPLPRYRRAWMSGQLLHFLEIPTARPVALLERRRGGLRDVAYLVMEDLAGSDLAAEVSRHGLSERRCAEITQLFVLLKTAGISHGDTKASNFLVVDDRTHLIDLDAMRRGLSGFNSDLQRFLDNWSAEERAQFSASFHAAGLIQSDRSARLI